MKNRESSQGKRRLYIQVSPWMYSVASRARFVDAEGRRPSGRSQSVRQVPPAGPEKMQLSEPRGALSNPVRLAGSLRARCAWDAGHYPMTRSSRPSWHCCKR